MTTVIEFLADRPIIILGAALIGACVFASWQASQYAKQVLEAPRIDESTMGAIVGARQSVFIGWSSFALGTALALWGTFGGSYG